MFREAILAMLGVGAEGQDGKCSAKETEICKAQFGEFFDWACEHCEKRGHDAASCPRSEPKIKGK